MDKLDELIMKAAETYVDPDVDKITAGIEVPALERDPSGTPICPGHPKMCFGSGDFAPMFECCCDECDYYLACFPEYQGEVNEALEDLRDRKNKTLSERLVGVLSSDIDEKAAREERAKNLLEEDPNARD